MLKFVLWKCCVDSWVSSVKWATAWQQHFYSLTTTGRCLVAAWSQLVVACCGCFTRQLLWQKHSTLVSVVSLAMFHNKDHAFINPPSSTDSWRGGGGGKPWRWKSGGFQNEQEVKLERKFNSRKGEENMSHCVSVKMAFEFFSQRFLYLLYFLELSFDIEVWNCGYLQIAVSWFS